MVYAYIGDNYAFRLHVYQFPNARIAFPSNLQNICNEKKPIMG